MRVKLAQLLCAITCALGCGEDTIPSSLLENSLKLSGTMTITADGGAASEATSSKDQRHHLVRLVPYSPSLVVDLTHTGCQLTRVNLLIPRSLPYASLKMRAYLEGVSARDQAVSGALSSQRWTSDPSAPEWTAISDIKALTLEHPTSYESLITLELSRATRLAAQPATLDGPATALRRALLDERSRGLNQLPEPLDLSLSPPCAQLKGSQSLADAPLTLRLSLELLDHETRGDSSERAQEARLGVVSGLRWSEASAERSAALIEQLNDAQLDAVILLGDLTQDKTLESLVGLTRSFGALEPPWLSTMGDEDRWLGARLWYQQLGFDSFGFDRGPVRVGLINTAQGEVSSEDRALIKRLGEGEGLLWGSRPAPKLRLLLSHLPILPLRGEGPLAQRSDAIRLLSLVIDNGLEHLLSATEGEPHPALKLTTLPDYSRSGQWLELSVSERCDDERSSEGCLSMVTHQRP